MDWTALFDESGEEDLLILHLLEEHPTEPRTTRLVEKLFHLGHEDEDSDVYHHRLFTHAAPEEAPAYSLKALYFLSINYILGVGCLGVPYAFARAGFVLCISILLIVTIFSYMTVMWVAETGARFEVQRQQSTTTGKEVTESSTLLRTTSPDIAGRYEVIDLVAHFLGPIHKFLYQTSLIFLMYVGLLAFTQVFCGSLAALLWNNLAPGLSQLLFAVMVIPLSCMELDEQVSIQSFMAAARFLAIFIMVAGSSLALCMDDSDENQSDTKPNPPYWAEEELDHMSYTWCFNGFGIAFSTALFSQLFQHSIPGLLRPLKGQPDLIHKAPQVFGASLLTTCSLYLLLGSSAASYFGADTKSSVNLNFANFHFGLNPETIPQWSRKLLQLGSIIVVVFPAMDTISVFPLIANTLGNNLYAATSPSMLRWVARHLAGLPRPTTRQYSDLGVGDRKALLEEASRISTIFWRMVAAIPPLLGSVWATDLSFSLLLSGIAGLYVAFFAPALLHLKCRDQTIFTGWYSSAILAYPVLGFACFALFVVVLQIDDAWHTMHPR